MVASGVLQPGGRPGREGFDVGRVAIGQGGEEGQLRATPLQMAEVAGAVANGGELMKPTLLQEAKDPDGRQIEELDPDEQSEVMSEETAAQVTEMMTNVANEGTAAGLSTGARPARRQDRHGGDRRRGRRSTAPGSSASPPPTTRRSRSRR